MERVRARVMECEVYSRVVGYFRPVAQWNDGKRQEFKERRTVSLASWRGFCRGRR
ncbi:MAG: hypothetical protein DSZ24_04295 [Thermodesulfatator sp.]|nr:MAG: hypothetical protein DSZ24_04295 [Thermodesulfatator sp.]